MIETNTLREKIYAGVLGKLIGVYLGRPIEGWPYKKIQETFGDVYHYVHRKVGVPLIVADDDISGTFGFFRAMEDNHYSPNLSSAQIGETWRNYIIEDKTILWWGGLGRSTEHTAYLNLINGIDAPLSGSIQYNGQATAEQIGAQIFIEGFAMCFPGDPEKTADLVRKAASVSHDGMAVDAACHLAALDAMAFQEFNINRLLDQAYFFLTDDRLRRLVCDVRNLCAKNSSWRQTRADLERLYGYRLYPGTCHIAPNHAMVLASILHGGDDFQESVMIAASVGWDTDCNAGNVGAFNGIRLGLDGIDRGADLRTEVADRLLVITSDGGAAVSDAVQEADRIWQAVCHLHQIDAESPKSRFSFSYPGALQGFAVCPYYASPSISIAVQPAVPGSGIGIRCNGLGRGVTAAVSTPTFVEFLPNETNYLSTASPALYETQTVCCILKPDGPGELAARIYVVVATDATPEIVCSDAFALTGGEQELRWTIPALGGRAILRVGLAFTSSTHYTGKIRLLEMDWSQPPANFVQQGTLMSSIWDTHPKRLQMWTSSAKNFAADMEHTFCISHPAENGLATIGTRDWDNYCVSSTIQLCLCKRAGLVLRCKGHRQYYGASFSEDGVSIFAMIHGVRAELASAPFSFEYYHSYYVKFSCIGQKLTLSIGNQAVLQAYDNHFARGGCGYFVDCGTMLADTFSVSALTDCKE